MVYINGYSSTILYVLRKVLTKDPAVYFWNTCKTLSVINWRDECPILICFQNTVIIILSMQSIKGRNGICLKHHINTILGRTLYSVYAYKGWYTVSIN